MDKKFEAINKIKVGGRTLLLSSFMSVAALFASSSELSAQTETRTVSIGKTTGESADFVRTEKVRDVFVNLSNDFAEKQKMFGSGEGKVVSPNQSMQLEKEGSNYFFIHPQTGEKFMASFTVDENNSGILILELKDGKGSFLFSKSFVLPKIDELVGLLEGFNKEDTSFEVFKNLGFNFIFKSNPTEGGVSYRGGEAIILTEEHNRAFLSGVGMKDK